MNLCGGEEYASGNLMPDICVKVDSEDQIDVVRDDISSQVNAPPTKRIEPEPDLLDRMAPVSPPQPERLRSKRMSKSRVAHQSKPSFVFSDDPSTIRATLDEVTTRETLEGKRTESFAALPISTPILSGDKSERGLTDTPPRIPYNPSPSPLLLNPLPSSISESSGKPSTLYSGGNHDRAQPVEQLIKRLEGGFKVKFVGGPGSQLWKHRTDLKLCLNTDRNYMVVQTQQDEGENINDDEKKEDEDSEIVLEVHVDKVLRLEVKRGRNTRLRRSFSLVAQKDVGHGVSYFGFEAESALDREVIVSTIMVLLDQTHHNPIPLRMSGYPEDFDNRGRHKHNSSKTNDNEGTLEEVGTMDQPIMCSPSLVEDKGSWQTESSHQLSPRQRTHIYHEKDATETSLAIDRRNDLSGDFLPEGTNGQVESLRYQVSHDSQNHGDNGPTALSTNAKVVAGNWCTDDVCSLALRDIADTCTGIFAKQSHRAGNLTESAKAESAFLEEYIATALGAPNAVYSYIMDRDVGNTDSATAATATVIEGGSRQVQNRANLLNAQAVRLRNLRNEMTFTEALRKSHEKVHFVKTTQSFDDASQYARQQQQQAASEAARRLHSSPLIKHVVESMMMGDTEAKPSVVDEVAYYDSDPEDVKPRILSKRGPRRVAADHKSNERFKKDQLGHSKKSVNVKALERIPTGKKVRKLDEDAVIDIVQVRKRTQLWFRMARMSRVLFDWAY